MVAPVASRTEKHTQPGLITAKVRLGAMARFMIGGSFEKAGDATVRTSPLAENSVTAPSGTRIHQFHAGTPVLPAHST